MAAGTAILLHLPLPEGLPPTRESLPLLLQTQAHLLEAWTLARPDDLIEGFGEHHGLMDGMLESAFKENWPEDLRRILDVTYRFSRGWRRIHNPDTGHEVADNLTTTEFAVAMLTAQGWTGREIAAHINVSPNTVKRHLAEIKKKLGNLRPERIETIYAPVKPDTRLLCAITHS